MTFRLIASGALAELLGHHAMARTCTLARLLLALAGALPAGGAESPAVSAVAPDYTSGFAIGPSARVLFATLSGDSYADRDLAYGTDLDLRDELGLTGLEPLPELGLKLGWWDAWSPDRNFRYGFEARGLWGGFEGKETLGVPIVFDGASFAAGERVTSTLSLDLTQVHCVAGWLWGTEARHVRLDLFFGMSVVGTELKLKGAARSESESLRLMAFGGGARIAYAPCAWFDVGLDAAYYGASFHWMGWAYDEYEEVSELIDLSAHVSVCVHEYAAVEVGYRFLDAELFREREDYYSYWQDEVAFDWTLQGWYLGATIRF